MLSCLRRAFSLIELTVVMACIGVLFTLLQPAISSALDRSSALQCQSNLKSLGTLTFLYVDDNNGYFPFPGFPKTDSPDADFRGHHSYGYSWDDLLSVYDGRRLSHELMSESGLYLNSKKNADITDRRSSLSLYRCPADDVERRSFGGSQRIGRSYAMNGYMRSSASGVSSSHLYHDQQSLKGIGAGVHSVQTHEIDDSSGTIYLAPSPFEKNELGGSTGHSLILPSQTYDPDNNGRYGLVLRNKSALHEGHFFNFLFTDGHVQYLLLQETHELHRESSYTLANKMWSRQRD